jgi:hypothetical protein
MPIGLFGPERIQFSSGGPAIRTQVYIFLPTTNVKAILFADPDALTTAANPVWTDDLGELTFFAEMGGYDLVANGARIPITVDTPGGSGGITEADLERVTHYTHHQTSPLSTWHIEHPMGYAVGGVQVQESTGDWVECGIAQNTSTFIDLSFDAPTSGVAYLS